MKNKEVIAGFARGLSNHSSMHNISSMFHHSHVFELSSIKRQDIVSQSSEDNQVVVPFSIFCKFCGKKEHAKGRLIKVCKCLSKCWAHEYCINGQQLKECTCKTCCHVFLNNYDKESEISQIEGSSILQSIEENSEKNQFSTPQMSSLSESSGEARMRRVIKAATLKPYCRICKSGSETLANKLIYPCQCHTVSPTKSWAHRECILDEILKNQSDLCIRCKAQFSFACELEKNWICKDSETCEQFSAQIFGLLLVIMFCIGVVAFLITTPGMPLDESESAYRWILVALLLLLLLLTIFLVVWLIYVKMTEKKVKSIFVLCQRQEIAKMTSSSHSLFLKYLEQQKHNNLIPLEVPQVKRKIEKDEKISNKIDEEMKKSEVIDDCGEQEISRLIVETDTNGENFDSKVLNEHSDLKESAIIHISFISSEDIRDEEMKEHSNFSL